MTPVILATAAAPLHATDTQVVPDGNGARNYFAPMPPRAGLEVMTDQLQRSLFDTVTRAARARGQAAPQPDARLEAFATTLARTLGPDEVPGVEMQEFLLSHFGLGEPIPELAMLQVILDDDIIQDKVRSSLPRVIAGGPFGRVGIGVQRRFLGRTSVVVALQRVEVEMLPIPRRLELGSSAMVAGRLLAGSARSEGAGGTTGRARGAVAPHPRQRRQLPDQPPL